MSMSLLLITPLTTPSNNNNNNLLITHLLSRNYSLFNSPNIALSCSTSTTPTSTYSRSNPCRTKTIIFQSTDPNNLQLLWQDSIIGSKLILHDGGIRRDHIFTFTQAADTRGNKPDCHRLQVLTQLIIIDLVAHVQVSLSQAPVSIPRATNSNGGGDPDQWNKILQNPLVKQYVYVVNTIQVRLQSMGKARDLMKMSRKMKTRSMPDTSRKNAKIPKISKISGRRLDSDVDDDKTANATVTATPAGTAPILASPNSPTSATSPTLTLTLTPPSAPKTETSPSSPPQRKGRRRKHHHHHHRYQFYSAYSYTFSSFPPHLNSHPNLDPQSLLFSFPNLPLSSKPRRNTTTQPQLQLPLQLPLLQPNLKSVFEDYGDDDAPNRPPSRSYHHHRHIDPSTNPNPILRSSLPSEREWNKFFFSGTIGLGLGHGVSSSSTTNTTISRKKKGRGRSLVGEVVGLGGCGIKDRKKRGKSLGEVVVVGVMGKGENSSPSPSPYPRTARSSLSPSSPPLPSSPTSPTRSSFTTFLHNHNPNYPSPRISSSYPRNSFGNDNNSNNKDDENSNKDGEHCKDGDKAMEMENEKVNKNEKTEMGIGMGNEKDNEKDKVLCMNKDMEKMNEKEKEEDDDKEDEKIQHQQHDQYSKENDTNYQDDATKSKSKSSSKLKSLLPSPDPGTTPRTGSRTGICTRPPPNPKHRSPTPGRGQGLTIRNLILAPWGV